MPVRLAYKLYQISWYAIDWIYPPYCGGCGRLGVRWCEACQQSVSIICPPICTICGQVQNTNGLCLRCQRARPNFTALRSYASFEGGLRKAIHRLKYSRDLGLGEVLARSMIELLDHLGWVIDIIVPVPLSLDRLKERGYNQASLLALPMAMCLGLPYQPQALTRIKETRSQVGLSVELRQQNVAGAFRATTRCVQGKSILVVDDVATSGATLDACAVALKEADSSHVYGLTLARPRGFHDDDPARPAEDQK